MNKKHGSYVAFEPLGKQFGIDILERFQQANLIGLRVFVPNLAQILRRTQPGDKHPFI